MPSPNTAFAPLAKTVAHGPGGWLALTPFLSLKAVVAILAFGGAVLALVASSRRRPMLAFVLSSLAVAGVVLTAGFALFPFVMPSSSDPRSSLTVYDSVSSHRTLQIMFWAVLIFLPLIVVYTSWCYRVMRGKITERHVRAGGTSLY